MSKMSFYQRLFDPTRRPMLQNLAYNLPLCNMRVPLEKDPLVIHGKCLASLPSLILSHRPTDIRAY